MALEADVNYGFKGEVTSAVTPIVLGRGVLYSVEGPLDLQVTSGGGGDRAVSVRQGSAWGDGVLSTWNTGAVLNGASVASGSRWDTVVIRREWTPESSPTGTATLMLLQGSSTRAISVSRTTDAGVTTSDQPIALVRFQAGQTAAQEIVDLRTWAGAGGGMVAVSDAALAYLNAPGTQVQIGFTQYTRTMIGGSPQWTTANLSNLENLPWSRLASPTVITHSYSTSGEGWSRMTDNSRIVQRGNDIELTYVARTSSNMAMDSNGEFTDERTIAVLIPEFRPPGWVPFTCRYRRNGQNNPSAWVPGHGYIDPRGDIVLLAGTRGNPLVGSSSLPCVQIHVRYSIS